MISHEFEYRDITYKLWAWDKTCCLWEQWVKYDTFYEIDVLEAIRKLNLGGIFVDVGANVGNHSLYFVNHCGAGRVLACEPEPHHYMALGYTLRDNHPCSEYITTIPYVISDYCGRADLKVGPQSPENVWMEKNPDGEFVTTTVDTIIDQKISLLKIDTEGTEMQVPRGAAKTIEKYHPVIVAEATVGHKYDSIDEYLKKFGYKASENLCKNGEAPTYMWMA